MFEIFLPYLIGVAMGITPEAGDGASAREVAAADATGSGTAAARTPEDQTPTGQFTTATEVKPILTATQGSWVAVRNYNGRDLLYFTQLLAWRCGLWGVQYGLNGATPSEPLTLEPCHDDTATPNAITAVEAFPPYLSFAENSIESVSIRLLYDDGTQDEVVYDRAAIQMP